MYNYSSPYIAVKRTRQTIRKDAYEIRKKLDLLSEPCFPIMKVIEEVLPKIDPDFSLDIIEDKDMGSVLAEAVPDQHVIRVMESVYKGACNDHYWHRMTMAHELGHYLYHPRDQLRLAKLIPGARVPVSCNPEIQADIFAAELLMPVNLIKDWEPRIIANKCVVSLRAAESQYRQIGYINHSKKKKTRSQKATWSKHR